MLDSETIIMLIGWYILGMFCIGIPMSFYLDLYKSDSKLLAGIIFYPIIGVLLIIKIIIQTTIGLVKIIVDIFKGGI